MQLSGGGAAELDQSPRNRKSIRHDFDSGNPNDVEAKTAHVFVTSPVVLNHEIVDVAVDLNDQLRRGTVEVGDIGANRMLSSKAHSPGRSP